MKPFIQSQTNLLLPLYTTPNTKQQGSENHDVPWDSTAWRHILVLLIFYLRAFFRPMWRGFTEFQYVCSLVNRSQLPNHLSIQVSIASETPNWQVTGFVSYNQEKVTHKTFQLQRIFSRKKDSKMRSKRESKYWIHTYS